MGNIQGLFYSQTEKIAFYVPNYYVDGTSMLDTIIENLQNERKKCVEMIGGEPKETIYSYVIENSRRYKHMRVFYVKTETCPKDAYVIGTDENIKELMGRGMSREQATWTIGKWITD